MKELIHRYFAIYHLDATKEMCPVEESYIETFKQEFDKVLQMERKQLPQEQLSEYLLILDNHYYQIRKNSQTNYDDWTLRIQDSLKNTENYSTNHALRFSKTKEMKTLLKLA